MAARGRGRGRGRGSSSQAERSNVDRQPKMPHSIDELKTYLFSLNEGNYSKYGELFANMVLEFGTNEANVKEAMNLIFDVVVDERDNASLGANICHVIVNQTNPSEPPATTAKRKLFLKNLLSRFQAEFGNRASTRSTSIEQWLSIFSFLSEVFHLIKINGQLIAVAGRAIVTGMEWLVSMEDCVEDEIECVCNYLKMFGKDLANINKDKMKSIIRLLREKAVSRQSSCKIRCVILEVLEFRAMGWQDIDNELDAFYLDAITDAAVEDDLINIKGNS